MSGFLNYLKGLMWRGPSMGDDVGAYRERQGLPPLENTPVEQTIINAPTPGFDGAAAPPAMGARPGGSLPAFTTFMESIAGQGLSTPEILDRAQAAGIPASQVLTELTKPEYQASPPNTMPFPGTDPRMRVENNFNVPPPGTQGLPMTMHSRRSMPPPMMDTSVGAFRAYEAENPPTPAPVTRVAPYRRIHNQHVVGDSDTYNYTAEGTFPDMVGMDSLPQPSEAAMGASVNYKHPNSAQGEMNLILSRLQKPVASPMTAMLSDRTQRRASMSAPVDIRRSDTVLDMPVRSPIRRRY